VRSGRALSLIATALTGSCALLPVTDSSDSRRTFLSQQEPIFVTHPLATIRYTWRESKLVAPFVLTASGTLNADGVRMQMGLRSRSRGRLANWGFTTGGLRPFPRGPFEAHYDLTKVVPSGRIKRIPSRPASYEVRLWTIRTAPRYELKKTLVGVVRIKAPVEGVVTSAKVSATRSGTHRGRLPRGTRRIWASFFFAPSGLPTVKPKATWYSPDGATFRTPAKSQKYAIRTSVGSAAGLGSGVWTCRLAVSGRVAKSVSVRVG